MSVYVDDMQAGFGRMVMCHMIADTTDELLAMADRIGVQRRWIQKAGTHGEHFDICKSKRAQAVRAGAIEITWLALGKKIMERRKARAGKQSPAPIPEERDTFDGDAGLVTWEPEGKL